MEYENKKLMLTLNYIQFDALIQLQLNLNHLFCVRLSQLFNVLQ